MTFYNIFNPTLARRIIYDGITNERRIEIMPGQGIANIELSDRVAANLRAMAGKVGQGEEIQLSELKAGVVLESQEAPNLQAKAMPLKIDDAGVTVIKAKPQKPVAST